MNQYAMKPMKQLDLFEEGVEMKKQPTKRVNIVSLRMVKESSILYKDRRDTGTGITHHIFTTLPCGGNLHRVFLMNYKRSVRLSPLSY